MARATTKDPLDRFRFIVNIDGFTHSGFTACTAPSYSLTVKDYPEGGNHLQPKKIVEGVSYKNVTLSRGVTGDTSFNKWATGFIDLVQHEAGTKNSLDFSSIVGAVGGDGLVVPTYKGGIAGTGKGLSIQPLPGGLPFSYRRTVKIQHMNSQGVAICTYILYGAFPVEYTPASDFDASSDDMMSIESLVLAYESFEVKFAGVASVAAEAIIGF